MKIEFKFISMKLEFKFINFDLYIFFILKGKKRKEIILYISESIYIY